MSRIKKSLTSCDFFCIHLLSVSYIYVSTGTFLSLKDYVNGDNEEIFFYQTVKFAGVLSIYGLYCSRTFS
ncbi:hypothetical protein HanIR_Chr10g0460461 [Helianthus annuus]|nr:hypothetical protein HanIR_Chr10g0460461 [Helianthus annuus]